MNVRNAMPLGGAFKLDFTIEAVGSGLGKLRLEIISVSQYIVRGLYSLTLSFLKRIAVMKTVEKVSILAACWLLSISFHTAQAMVRLPRLVGDGMVLQRDAEVKIWGWADANEKVTVSFNAQTYHTTTGADGRWSVTLAASESGGPYDMTIHAGNEIVLKNILVGDVWVCSGQSNMELPMFTVKDHYADEIVRSANPMIRQFKVPVRYSFTMPLDDLESGQWQSADSSSVLWFSAVGYFSPNRYMSNTTRPSV